MSNSSFPVLHGLLNSTHASDLHAYYPTSNLPTPWPLVIISSLVSLVIAVIGFKSALITWNDPSEISAIKQSAAQDGWLVRFRGARQARKENKPYIGRQQQVGLMDEIDPEPPAYELHEHNHGEVLQRSAPWRIFNMSTTHMIIVFIGYKEALARYIGAKAEEEGREYSTVVRLK